MSNNNRALSTAKLIRIDLAVVFILFIVAGVASFICSEMIGRKIIQLELHNIWFDADIGLVYRDMSNLHGYHRTSKHPLFFPLTYPVVKALKIMGFSTFFSVRILLAVVAGLWAAVVYSILKLTRFSPLESVTFSLLALVSSSFLFWAPVPETFFIGSLTILLALLLVAAKDHIRHKAIFSTFISILTLGISTTNWIAGIAATCSLHPWRRSIKVTVIAFCTVVVLAVFQWKFLNTVGLFFDLELLKKEVDYLQEFKTEGGGVLEKWRAFFWHSVVMPEIEIRDLKQWKSMSVQASASGSGSAFGIFGVVAWSALLTLGVYGLYSSNSSTAFRVCLGVILAGHLVLHSVFGAETFLFSAHYGVLLVLLASWGTAVTRLRPLVLGLGWALIVIAVINNGSAFLKAIDILKSS